VTFGDAQRGFKMAYAEIYEVTLKPSLHLGQTFPPSAGFEDGQSRFRRGYIQAAAHCDW
jgi:hypothetical protein